MAVPKKKMSRSRTRRRKAVWKLERPRAASCPQCGAAKRPHRACPECGVYRGREFPAAVTEKE
ncbi:MAG: 50S ribosomal protein L32 [Acidimicrobiia bacterium]|nr:50S ribosomal protein L32 [Acidimicrobiia bacterium]